MPVFWLAVIGLGLWAIGSASRAAAPAAGPLPVSDATAAELARLCAQTPEAVALEPVGRLSAWAECPGRSIRDLRVLATRLERAATDETADQTRRASLIDAHVGLVDWIERRERERERERAA